LTVAATAVYSGVVTFAIVFAIDKTIGLRVSEEDERTGLDLTQHGEAGYDV
jgi:Amt family ammonium transporter